MAVQERKQRIGRPIEDAVLARASTANAQCDFKFNWRRRTSLLVSGTQDKGFVLKESFQNSRMLVSAEGVEGSGRERRERALASCHESRTARDCRRESKHGRASLASSGMQLLQDGGLLLREAFHLLLERCSALRVKAILQ